MTDPKRLLDEPRLLDDASSSAELRDLLDAGKSELPNQAQLAALAGKLGLLAGGAAGGGAAVAAGGAGGAAKASAPVAASVGKGIGASLVAKVTTSVVLVGAVTTTTVYVTKHDARAPVAAVPSGASAPKPAPPPAAPPPVPEPAAPSAEPPPKPAAARPPEDPDAEQKLVDQALKAKSAAQPERALALCNEHARRFPAGMFAQEREVVAIESLVKLGRRAEAEERAARFSARYPGSAHLRRVKSLLEAP